MVDLRRCGPAAMAVIAGVGCAACGAANGSPVATPGADAAASGPPQLTAPTLQALQALSPTSLPPPPPDVTNKHADDPAAAALGHKLFFDPSFSGKLLDSDNMGDSHSLGTAGQSGKVACAGCHIPSASFLDNRSTREQVSLAAGWGKRRTRHLLDIGQAKLIMWDGRRDALYNQPFQPIETAVEMNSSRLYVAEQIYQRYRSDYEAVFGPIPIPLNDATRFPQLTGATTGCQQLDGNNNGVGCHGMPGDGAEYDTLQSQDRTEVTRVVVNMGKALGAYERLLTCGPSRFDQWMHGQANALTAAEQRGAALFVGHREDGTTTVGCNLCHSGPFLTDQTFHNVGMRPVGVGPAGSFYDSNDNGAKGGLAAAMADPLNTNGQFSDGTDGRLPTTLPANADGAFRTPSLRCVSRRPSFMHNGQIISLDDVISFFDRGGDTSGYTGTSENFARQFTAQERADLVAFLMTLDGPGPAADLVVAPSLPGSDGGGLGSTDAGGAAAADASDAATE